MQLAGGALVVVGVVVVKLGEGRPARAAHDRRAVQPVALGILAPAAAGPRLGEPPHRSSDPGGRAASCARATTEPGTRLAVTVQAGEHAATLEVLFVRHRAGGWVREITRKSLVCRPPLRRNPRQLSRESLWDRRGIVSTPQAVSSGGFSWVLQRRGRDSNPGYVEDAQRFSRRAQGPPRASLSSQISAQRRELGAVLGVVGRCRGVPLSVLWRLPWPLAIHTSGGRSPRSRCAARRR